MIRWVGHKMFLHPVLIDLVDRFANSVCVQPVALLELSVPFGIARPSSSCLTLSRCKQLTIYCRGRLHATVFGKIAILSLERVSNCTENPYFLRFPSIFVWNNPRLCQVAWSLLHTIIIFHRVYLSEEHRLSSSFGTLSSRNPSTSDY